jgi:hypothetical protein
VTSDRQPPSGASDHPGRRARGVHAARHGGPGVDAQSGTGQWRNHVSAAGWTRRGLFGAVTATLVGLTLFSRDWQPAELITATSLNGMTAMPQQPPTSPAQLVPVRTLAAPGSSAVPGSRVMLRQLIIATDADDFQLPAWTTILNQVGTPYDVLFAKQDALGADRLVRSDGVGRYNAILLTSNTLLYEDGSGQYVSAFTDTEWQTLWDYERTYQVRQVALNAAPGETPEDYYLRAWSEGPVGDTPVLARLTSDGASVFDRLSPAIEIPIAQTYAYRTRLAEQGDAQPLLTLDADVIGVLSTAPDGRERAAVTFALSPALPATSLLGYGLLRWATRGIFLGEQRHWLNVDVDDWFNADATGSPDQLIRAYRLTGPEAAAASQQQAELRRRHPLAAGFTLNLAYNGAKLDPAAPAQYSTVGTPDSLTSYSRFLRHEFRWINHTLTHPQMNFSSYSESHQEIRDNLVAAALIGLPVPSTVFKPPEYSGLGVYDPHSSSSPATGPIQQPGPVTDFGLKAANKALLKAASDVGVKYIVGDMSFRSEQPSVFNGGIYIPLQPDLLLVPTWPTNIAFEATTQPEQVAWYNSMYGVNGSLDRSSKDYDYAEYLDAEASLALGQVIRGSAYSFTVHQTNLHEYALGRSLLFDWLDAVVTKYGAFYRTPLNNPDWLTLAAYAEDRTAHFEELRSQPDAVWDAAAKTVTYTPAKDAVLFITGLATKPATAAERSGSDRAEKYGSDTISRLGLVGGQTVTLATGTRS